VRRAPRGFHIIAIGASIGRRQPNGREKGTSPPASFGATATPDVPTTSLSISESIHSLGGKGLTKYFLPPHTPRAQSAVAACGGFRNVVSRIGGRGWAYSTVQVRQAERNRIMYK